MKHLKNKGQEKRGWVLTVLTGSDSSVGGSGGPVGLAGPSGSEEHSGSVVSVWENGLGVTCSPYSSHTIKQLSF